MVDIESRPDLDGHKRGVWPSTGLLVVRRTVAISFRITRIMILIAEWRCSTLGWKTLSMQRLEAGWEGRVFK